MRWIAGDGVIRHRPVTHRRRPAICALAGFENGDHQHGLPERPLIPASPPLLSRPWARTPFRQPHDVPKTVTGQPGECDPSKCQMAAADTAPPSGCAQTVTPHNLFSNATADQARCDPVRPYAGASQRRSRRGRYVSAHKPQRLGQHLDGRPVSDLRTDSKRYEVCACDRELVGRRDVPIRHLPASPTNSSVVVEVVHVGVVQIDETEAVLGADGSQAILTCGARCRHERGSRTVSHRSRATRCAKRLERAGGRQYSGA